MFLTFYCLQVISYDSSRGGVSVITDKGEATTSYLLIQDAVAADSGKYSCSPSNADVASVRVHVLNGENTQYLFFVALLNTKLWQVKKMEILNYDRFGNQMSIPEALNRW